MSQTVDFIFVSNTSWYIWNFRINLIKKLIKKNYSILVVAPKDNYSNLIISTGCKFVDWDLNRSSINPISELKSLIKIYRIYKKYKPKIIHHFTIKSCFYGSLAAKIINKSYVFNSITGIGHLFINKKIKNQILRILILPIYRYALDYKNSKLIFQNPTNANLYKKFSLTKEENSLIIYGSGVNSNFFSPLEKKYSSKKRPIILFSGRIIKEKGIIELLKACSILWDKGHDFNLKVVGNFDSGNRSCLGKNELKKQINSKNKNNIIFTGLIGDMKSIYSEADIVVLPSWGEGLSRTLLEASSMECAIIASNVCGCNDIIDHGINGLLVPVKDENSLSLAIEFILRNHSFARKLGKNARKKVIERFDEEKITKETVNLYEAIEK